MASLSLTFWRPPILVWLGGMMMKERVVDPTYPAAWEELPAVTFVQK